MAGAGVLLACGSLVPSTLGPHVEQVGWGVARQVARQLAGRGVADEAALLEVVADRAETPGWLAYVALASRTATALALVHVAGERATYVGEVVDPAADAGTREALLVRALHDAGAAGARVLDVTCPTVDLAAWPHANDR